MNTVAAFDFDGTLTLHDTLIPFLIKTTGYWGLGQALIKSTPSLTMFALNIISNERAKQQLIEKSLKGKDANLLRQLAIDWVPSIPIRPEMLERLKWHKNQNHKCVLVSASVDLYVEEAARYLGFDHVACTRLSTSNSGVLTGYLSTPNCWGEQKVIRLQELVGPLEQVTLFAYGDSAGDIPMLRAAQYAWMNGKPFLGN